MPIIFTSHAEKSFSPTFKSRVLAVFSYFPELQGTIVSCGAIRTDGTVQGTATAWSTPPVFRVRPGTSSYTIAHELTHLVQGNGSGIPHGEVACDIWTIDRMPLEYLDERPHYLLHRIWIDWGTSKKDVKRLCRDAILLRNSRRKYIVWLRHRIKEL